MSLKRNRFVDSAFAVFDDGDATKIIQIQVSALTTATTRTWTAPDASGTLTLLGNSSTGSGTVVLDNTPTITTPTFVAPSSGTSTIPSGGGVLLSTSSTATVTNKSLVADNTLLIGSADNTKKLQFDVSGSTAAKTMTIVSSPTLDRSLTLPNATDTLVGKATTDVFTNKSMSEAQLTFTDITTGNVSTSVHGFTPKAPNSATQFLDGTGAWNNAAWTSYTPTLTNATLGNGTISGWYMQIGKTVVYTIKFVLGTTSIIVGGPLVVSLPVTTVGSRWVQFNAPFGQVIYVRGSNYIGVVDWYSTTQVELAIMNVGATYPTQAGVTATVPGTWASGDSIYVNGIYEAA